MVALALLLIAAPDDARVKVVSSRALPRFEAVSFYPAAGVKPGKPLPKPALTVTNLDEPFAVPAGGPFVVAATPKGGLPVRVADGFAAKPGETRELNLAAALGVVEVFGDDFPRAARVVLSATDDPGPGEKGHTPVQAAGEYRVPMAVPDGVYAVWVVPANGARPQKVTDRVRVLAGKTVRVE